MKQSIPLRLAWILFSSFATAGEANHPEELRLEKCELIKEQSHDSGPVKIIMRGEIKNISNAAISLPVIDVRQEKK